MDSLKGGVTPIQLEKKSGPSQCIEDHDLADRHAPNNQRSFRVSKSAHEAHASPEVAGYEIVVSSVIRSLISSISANRHMVSNSVSALSNAGAMRAYHAAAGKSAASRPVDKEAALLSCSFWANGAQSDQ